MTTYNIDASDTFEFGVHAYQHLPTGIHGVTECVTKWADKDTGTWCWVCHDKGGDWHYGLSESEYAEIEW